MPSGGHANSGPGRDPNALRRDRKDDAAWVTLPAGGYAGKVPEFPLEKIAVYDIYFEDKRRVKVFDPDATESLRDREVALWEALWVKPQAHMWAKLGLEYEVAAYVRAFIESTSADSNSGLKTAALRMSAEIGLSLPGMKQMGWKFSEDEVAGVREEKARAVSARDRLRAING